MEERLRKFACLVELGSFTKAAKALHVSQPALSSAVAKLERELKADLLLRGSRVLRLTSAGQLAYETAKTIAAKTDNLTLQLAQLANRPVALKIGMIDSVAELLFSSREGAEMLEQPAKVSIIVNNSRHLLQAVQRGELHVAFIAEQQKSLPTQVEAHLVASEPLVVVSHAAYPLPLKRSLDFIAYDQASNTYRLVQRALRDFGVSIKPTFYSTSPAVILQLVQQQKGVAALPYFLVQPQLESGAFICMGTPRWVIWRPIIAIKRRDTQLPDGLLQLSRQLSALFVTLDKETRRGT